MEHRKFKERQKFNDTIVLVLLWAGILATIYGLVNTVGNEGFSFTAIAPFIISLGILGFLLWMFNQMTLKISVNEARIKYKLTPLHRKSRRIYWKDVRECYVVQSPELSFWHGGNIGFGGEELISLNGRNGLRIETRDGRHIFIGCRDVEALSEVLHHWSLSDKSQS